MMSHADTIYQIGREGEMSKQKRFFFSDKVVVLLGPHLWEKYQRTVTQKPEISTVKTNYPSNSSIK